MRPVSADVSIYHLSVILREILSRATLLGARMPCLEDEGELNYEPPGMRTASKGKLVSSEFLNLISIPFRHYEYICDLGSSYLIFNF